MTVQYAIDYKLRFLKNVVAYACLKSASSKKTEEQCKPPISD